MFIFIGGSEMFFIIVLAVMIFGADKIPDIARNLAKGMRQVKDATNDIKREITASAKDNGLDTDLVKELQDSVTTIKKEVTDNLDDLTGPIKRRKN